MLYLWYPQQGPIYFSKSTRQANLGELKMRLEGNVIAIITGPVQTLSRLKDIFRLSIDAVSAMSDQCSVPGA